MRLDLPAHAKINLALAVGPSAPPRGYHPIHSWFVPVDLHDTLTIEPLASGQPSRRLVEWALDAPRPSPIDWPLDKDLAVRAHRLLETELSRPLPLSLTVTKRIPVGGGLGGGSSDAAAALVGINHALDLGLSAPQLRALSVKLGSDVAFFIDDSVQAPPRPAVVSGFGESIARTAPVAAEVVLIFPPFGCPTGPVYAAFDERPHPPIDPARLDTLLTLAARTGRVPDEHLFNDLLEPALLVEPRLAGLLAPLDAAARAHSARVHMTGSGSTLFAIVPPSSTPAALATALAAAAPQAMIVPTHTTPTRPQA